MDRERDIIREELVRVARAKRLTNYSDVGRLVGLDMSTDAGRIWIAQLLDQINQDEVSKGGPMLSALVTYKDTGVPGPGFFECARGLGKYHGESKLQELEFCVQEVIKVHNYWTNR